MTAAADYNPPNVHNDHNNMETMVELQINKINSISSPISPSSKDTIDLDNDEELKQEELKEGDDDTGNNENNNNNKKVKFEAKIELNQVNTLDAMEKDIEKHKNVLTPRHKKQGTGLRRRAFTANTGLNELISHPMSYQAQMIEGPGFYIMGIIDILQEYTWAKRIERFAKVFIKCVDGYGISCIEPTIYRKRFLAKMLQIGIGRKSLQYQ
eukprot:145798_1